MKTMEQLVAVGLTEKKAEDVMLLERAMLEHAVKFSYTKKDGSVREANGTLRRDMMEGWQPKGEARPEPPSILRYFDLDAMDWRCFNVLNFLSMQAI